MEFSRRWGLLICVTAGIWLSFFVPLSPFVTLEPVDFAEKQKGESRLSEQGQYLAQLPLNDYVAEVTKDKTIPVAGAEWTAFFDRIIQANQGHSPLKQWARRISPDDKNASSRQVFFRPDEAPLSSLAGKIEKPVATQYLALTSGTTTIYLDLNYHLISSNDFHFGSGYSHYPRLPAFIFHPYRPFGLGLILAGLIFYLLLPWPKKRPEAIYYPAWRIRLGDFASMLLFVVFFTLPLLIIGGSLQAFIMAWFLILILWPLALVGTWLLWQMALSAAYEIVIGDDGLHISTPRAKTTHLFRDMAYFQPLVLRPPRWLIILSWLAAFAGKGRQRIGAAGRALMLEGSAYQGLGVKLKDGSSAYFWLTDQMGTRALKNSGRMIRALTAAGIPRKEEVKKITGITMPAGESRTRTEKRSRLFLAVFLIMPLAGMVLITGLVSFIPLGRAPKIAAAVSTAEKTGGPGTKIPMLDTDVDWEKTFKMGEVTGGLAFKSTGDGGFILAGFNGGEGADVDLFAAKLDAQADISWEKSYSGPLWEYGYDISPVDEGGFLLAGERRPENSFLGKSDILAVKVDPAGNLLWEKTFGREEAEEIPFFIRPTKGGRSVVLGKSGTAVIILEIDESGRLLSERRFPTSIIPDAGEILWAETMKEGDIIGVGEKLNPGIGFKDLVLFKLGAAGDEKWIRTFGGKKKESGTQVIPTSDGGFAATGITQSIGNGGDDLYLIKTDAEGRLVWEKAFGGKGDESGRRLLQTEDGGFLAVGDCVNDQGASKSIYLVKTDAAGDLEWEKHIGRGGFAYEGVSIGRAGDGAWVVLGNRTSGMFFQTEACLIKLIKK